jgi:uncharacterized protein DUF1707
MSSELIPHAKLLMGDADRERVVARLHTAVGEGRLTLGEFEDRMSGVLVARTFGEVEPFVADLPSAPAGPVTPSGPVDLSVTGSRIVRNNRWTVPTTLRLRGVGSSALLDFTQAIVTSSVVAIEVDLHGSSLRLIVPEGTSVDAGGTSLIGSSVKVRRVSEYAQPGQTGAHIVVTGSLKGSSIKASTPRERFWRRWFTSKRIQSQR